MADKKTTGKNSSTDDKNKMIYDDERNAQIEAGEDVADDEDFDDDDIDYADEKPHKNKVLRRVGIAIGCIAVLALVIVGVVYAVVMRYYNMTNYIKDDDITTMAAADAETYTADDGDDFYISQDITNEAGEVIGSTLETIDYDGLTDDEKESVDAQIEEELSQASDEQQEALEMVDAGQLYLPTDQDEVMVVNSQTITDEYDTVETDSDGNITSVTKDGTTYNVVSSTDDSVIVVKSDSDYTVNTDDDGNVVSVEKNGETYDISVNDDGETTVTTSTGSSSDSDYVTVDTSEKSDVYNLLLIGADTRANSEDSGNSDTIILISINKTKGTINMISFMRDLYANIPGYGVEKINHAFRYGGGPLLVQTLEENYGVSIDNYAMVDFYAMQDIVDALGGLTLTLSEEEVEVANNYIKQMCIGTSMTASDYYISGSGSLHLNGLQTVAYCRIRYVGRSDYERTQRQRTVLVTMFNTLKTKSVSEIDAFLNTALPYVTHNISSSTLATLMVNAPTYLGYSISQYRVPFDGYYSYSGSILVPDFAYTISRLNKIIYY